MKMHNVKAIYCTETDRLLEFTIINRNNLSRKRKVEFKRLQKLIKEIDRSQARYYRPIGNYSTDLNDITHQKSSNKKKR